MNVRLNTMPVCLAKHQAVTLTGAHGALIRCLRGVLWVTQNRDQRDIVLNAGESFTLDRRGPAMVWSLADSTLELRPHPPQRLDAAVRMWAQRVHRALAGLPQQLTATPQRIQ